MEENLLNKILNLQNNIKQLDSELENLILNNKEQLIKLFKKQIPNVKINNICYYYGMISNESMLYWFKYGKWQIIKYYENNNNIS